MLALKHNPSVDLNNSKSPNLEKNYFHLTATAEAPFLKRESFNTFMFLSNGSSIPYSTTIFWESIAHRSLAAATVLDASSRKKQCVQEKKVCHLKTCIT